MGTTVLVIDTTTNSILQEISLPKSSQSIAITPDGDTLYVGGSDDVFVISTTTNTLIDTVPKHFNGSLYLSVSRDGSKVYVPNQNSFSAASTLSIIDTDSNLVPFLLPTGSAPIGVAFTPDGQKALVTNSGDNTVTIIDAKTNRVITTVPVGNGPFGIAIGTICS